MAWTRSAAGNSPSVHPLWEQKLYSVVSVPLGVILNTFPKPMGPPASVVPYKSPLLAWTSAASGGHAVRASALRAEAVYPRQPTTCGDLKDRPHAFGPAIDRYPVKVPVGCL